MTLTQRQVGVSLSQPTIHILLPVCALYFIFGVVCAFFGYRCFKAIMFLYGFIFGSIVVYLICAEEEVLPGIIYTVLYHHNSQPYYIARVEQCCYSCVCWAVVWSDHNASAICGALHAGFSYRSANKDNKHWE